MLLNQKLTTGFITFMLIISSFSFLFICTDNVTAENIDPEMFDELSRWIDLLGKFLNNVMSPHPYRYVGAYYVNKTLNITGDVVFDLYFSSTILTILSERYQDKVNVSMHYIPEGAEKAKPIENANFTTTLTPDISEDVVHKQADIKIKNINHTLTEGQYLILSVELIQSEKPISEFIADRYERRIKPNLDKIANLLNSSEEPDISEIGGMLKEVLDALDELGISSQDIGDLANSFKSSYFYYGSKNFKSSVFLPISNTIDNKTLYFHNAPDLLLIDPILQFAYVKTVNETAPTSEQDYSWPPAFDTSGEMDLESEDGGWMEWFFIWLIYVMEGLPRLDEIFTYYLTSEGTLVSTEPDDDTESRFAVSRDVIVWDGIVPERNKIIDNATAELYLHYPRLISLIKSTINITLYDETEKKEIGSDEITLDRTTVIELLSRGPETYTMFTFENAFGKEIWYNHNYSLRIMLTRGPIFSFRPTYLLCDSEKYPSSVSLHLKETDNIKITEGLEEKKIVPGGSAEFTIKINSEYDDSIDIKVAENYTNSAGKWTIDYPKSIDIAKDSFALVNIYVNSTENTTEAYGNYVNLSFNVTGNTGFVSMDASVIVSEYAVDYEAEIDVQDGLEIRHGERGTYNFIIRNLNTGFWYDNYEVNVTSEHNWNISYNASLIYLDAYSLNEDEYVFNVTVSVPEFTEIETDKLTLKLISKEAGIHDKEYSTTVTVTTTVGLPNIFEHFYEFFQSVAEDFGLDDVFGENAGAFLLFIIAFIIFFFIIIIVALLKRKFIEVICLDRIKDINPDEEAKYEISIKNPSNKALTYEIKAEMDSESDSWEIGLEKERVIVEAKQSKAVILTVRPTDNAKLEDWVEVKVVTKIAEKAKEEEISTLTSLASGNPEVTISGVLHWPRVFKKGDRVETSFRLRNTGNVSAKNISVILYVNGKEKNKVEDITIPRGGYAELEIPWIAVKGKNDVKIIVK